MRIAVLADIHGNLAALDAVLADLAMRRVDLTVNLGDVVSGPLWPAETADRLIPLDLPTIGGNHERQLLTLSPEKMGESDRFAACAITPDHRVWLATFPPTLVPTPGVFLCHGVPANDNDYLVETINPEGFRPATPDEVAERATPRTESLLFCGHSHIPRSVSLPDGRVVANPGSVGLQAYSAAWPHPHVVQTGSPHARYAVAEQMPGGWSIEFLQVDYDWESAARRADSNGRADWAHALRTGIA